jgi:hypothetical protein
VWEWERVQKGEKVPSGSKKEKFQKVEVPKSGSSIFGELQYSFFAIDCGQHP